MPFVNPNNKEELKQLKFRCDVEFSVEMWNDIRDWIDKETIENTTATFTVSASSYRPLLLLLYFKSEVDLMYFKLRWL